MRNHYNRVFSSRVPAVDDSELRFRTKKIEDEHLPAVPTFDWEHDHYKTRRSFARGSRN